MTALQHCIDDELPIVLIITKELYCPSEVDELCIDEFSNNILLENYNNCFNENDDMNEIKAIIESLSLVLNTSTYKLIHLCSTVKVLTLKKGTTQKYNLANILRTVIDDDEDEAGKKIKNIMKTCDDCFKSVIRDLSVCTAPFPLISRINVAEILEQSLNKTIWDYKDTDIDDVLERIDACSKELFVLLNETLATTTSVNTIFPALEFCSENNYIYSNCINGAIFGNINCTVNKINMLPIDWANPTVIHNVMDIINDLSSDILSHSKSDVSVIQFKKSIQRIINEHLKHYFDEMNVYLLAPKRQYQYNSRDEDDVFIRHKRKEMTNINEHNYDYDDTTIIDSENISMILSERDINQFDNYNNNTSTKKKKKFWNKDEYEEPDIDNYLLMDILNEKAEYERWKHKLESHEEVLELVKNDVTTEELKMNNSIEFLKLLRDEREQFHSYNK